MPDATRPTAVIPLHCVRCCGRTNGGTYLNGDGPYCGWCMALLRGPTPDEELDALKARIEKLEEE